MDVSSFSRVQIAVMRETDAKGPFCSTVMAVVVVKDVLLFVCLAMNLEFANMVRQFWSNCSQLHAWHQGAKMHLGKFHIVPVL